MSCNSSKDETEALRMSNAILVKHDMRLLMSVSSYKDDKILSISVVYICTIFFQNKFCINQMSKMNNKNVV